VTQINKRQQSDSVTCELLEELFLVTERPSPASRLVSSRLCVTSIRTACISRLTTVRSLNHSTGMENGLVILLVLEELSNDAEDRNVAPESACRSALSGSGRRPSALWRSEEWQHLVGGSD
jgi:hypothetical protein